MDALLQVRNFSLGAEIFEDIRLRESDVHAAQIKQIFKV